MSIAQNTFCVHCMRMPFLLSDFSTFVRRFVPNKNFFVNMQFIVN